MPCCARSKKCHLAGWKKVGCPVIEGKMEIHSVKRMSKALVGKWQWRLGNGCED